MSQSPSNLSRSDSSMIILIHQNETLFFFYLASCQLLRSNLQTESRSSTIYQSPLFNVRLNQPELSFHPHDLTANGSQSVSNQSGIKGILKIPSVPSICNLLSTFDGKQKLILPITKIIII